MNEYKLFWRELIREVVSKESGRSIDLEEIIAEIPPRPELGDLAFPMFPFAPLFRTSPKEIAERVAGAIKQDHHAENTYRKVEVQGSYLNIHLSRPIVSASILTRINKEGREYGRNSTLAGSKVMVEFSCPNTNKPLHLGHLRNDTLGMSISRIMQENGAAVLRVNLINDRGIHICKSMLAYREFGGNSTPEQEKLKGDHLVGEYYVRFNSWVKDNPEAEEAAREMLKAWEENQPEVRELWEKMNNWAIEGIEDTYRRTGISFDRIYRESETYQLGREEVFRGLEKKVFYREKDGSVWVDLSDQNLDRKVLLRSDGTTLYLTQDIGTAVQRQEHWPFDRLIYVVASEQRYHFQVLFQVLKLLGHQWAENLFHLAYGMVNLPQGKMKSREGTVVDADDLLDNLVSLAGKEIRDRERAGEVDDIRQTAEKIALGALNYYLLQASPYKDMIFNPAESILFTGNTGPYLQYTGARIASILRKFRERQASFSPARVKPELLTTEEEWEIIKLLASYPEVVNQAAVELNPAIITSHLYDLAKSFSRFYHDHPVLHNDDPDLVVTRIELVNSVLQVMRNGLSLIGVPFLEKM